MSKCDSDTADQLLSERVWSQIFGKVERSGGADATRRAKTFRHFTSSPAGSQCSQSGSIDLQVQFWRQILRINSMFPGLSGGGHVKQLNLSRPRQVGQKHPRIAGITILFEKLRIRPPPLVTSIPVKATLLVVFFLYKAH